MAVGFWDLEIAKQERFETDRIDEFWEHFTRSMNATSKKLSDKEEEATVEDHDGDEHSYQNYIDHLNDQQAHLGYVQHLGEELLILALFKETEITTNGMIDRYFPQIPTRERHKTYQVRKWLPFKMKGLPHFRAWDELRCISNSIKHAGLVSPELANYSGWHVGEELTKVRDAYVRLRPLVQKYIRAFAATSRTHQNTYAKRLSRWEQLYHFIRAKMQRVFTFFLNLFRAFR